MNINKAAPKISCILTSFNKPQFLQEAIESVLNQTYQDFELILIDGGSDAPGMKEILQRYQNTPKIRLYFTGETLQDRKKKIMHSFAINKALEFTKGEYITYLCDDDIYYPRRFEKMIEKLEGDKNIAVVYSWQRLCNLSFDGIKTNCYVRKVWGLRGKSAKPSLPLDTYVDGIAFMHRKSCLKKLQKPYWPEEKDNWWHYDGIFAEKLGEHFIFYPIEEILFEHRFTHLSANYGFIPRWRIGLQAILGFLSRKKFRVVFK